MAVWSVGARQSGTATSPGWAAGRRPMPRPWPWDRRGPQVVKQLHEGSWRFAEDKGAKGRRMRIDTTVVETNNPLSTDSTCWETGCGY